MSGALPAVKPGPGISAGDPLAASAPPRPAPSEPPAASRPAPSDPIEALVARPAAPPEAKAPEPATATPSPAAASPPAGETPVAEPDEPHHAHPSDETPPGYVTAASLWKISAPRPDWDTGQSTAPETPPADGPREAASAAAGVPAAAAPAEPARMGDTRHAFPALAPTGEPPKKDPKPQHLAPANRARMDGRTFAIVGIVVLLAVLVTTALVVLTGGDEPKRAAAPADTPVAVEDTPEPTPEKTAAPKKTPAPIEAQVKTLDELVRFSAKGRKSAVNGDMKAAIANRSKLLKDIKALDKQAKDKDLKAALASFDAAITESLRQNRECASKCSTADLNKVGKLKDAALARINPLLKEHGGRTYKREEI
jgi:hypothetical protein